MTVMGSPLMSIGFDMKRSPTSDIALLCSTKFNARLKPKFTLPMMLPGLKHCKRVNRKENFPGFIKTC